MYFSDVVWTGLATQHVRKGFGTEVSQEQLRQYWSVISPAAYLDRLKGRDLKSLLIWATRDSSFLPEYSRQVIEFFRSQKLAHEEVILPCGHYTTGRFPFKLMDGLAMCRFLDHNM
jgi:pimeloyl-ACP methyl ester carboxylesterase